MSALILHSYYTLVQHCYSVKDNRFHGDSAG